MSDKSLMVVATQVGHYGGIVRTPGTPSGTFTLTDPKHFSTRWMARMDGKAAEAFHENVARKREVDHLTGERIASGGVREALSIAHEQIAELTRTVDSLKAELLEARADKEAEVAREETGLEEGDFGGEVTADAGEATEEDTDTTVDETADAGDTEPEPAPTTRRRRHQA